MDIRLAGILQHNTSLDVLNFMIRVNAGVKAYKSILAKAAGCHLSFLSLVLTGKNLLSTEHAAALCNFWNFNEIETDFFITLVSMEKAGSALLTAKYARDLEKIRSRAAERYVQPGEPGLGEVMSLEDITQYTSNWHFPVLHLALKSLNNVEALAKRFYLPTGIVEDSLNALL